MEINRNQEFDRLLKEKNHKELIMKLDDILKELSKERGESENEIDISGIEEAINGLQLAEELQKTTTAIDAMVSTIAKKLDERKEEKKQWTFKVKRDADGFIDVVEATSD